MKKIIAVLLVGCVCGVAFAASVKPITVPVGSLSATWVNTDSPKAAVTLKGVYFSTSIATNETYLLKVSNAGTTYTILSTNTATSGTSAYKAFTDVPFVCSYGDTVTVTRSTMTTGAVVNTMLVVE